MIVFACFAPHPPLLLPTIGSEKERERVGKTIKGLTQLGKIMKGSSPKKLTISSPHPDWGFNVPLHFLTDGFEGEIKTYLTKLESPKSYFKKGRKVYQEIDKDRRHGLIASGDLSHRLKKDGPYGFHPEGPKFDQKLIEALKKKDTKTFLTLDEKFPQAGECGLRSFSFVLGILEAAEVDWQPQILSYEGPFGVGYLVANLKLR